MNTRASRYLIDSPLHFPLYRWGPSWGPWGSLPSAASDPAAYAVSTPLTCPPVYVGAPLNRWVEAVYDFPVVYHHAGGLCMPLLSSSSSSSSTPEPVPEVRAGALGAGVGGLVRATPFLPHELPVPSDAARHRAIRADLASRLPPPSSVILGGHPGPRGLAMCVKGTVEGAISGVEWELQQNASLPRKLGFVFSLPTGFSSVKESSVVSVERLQRLMGRYPLPDILAHIVPESLVSAAEYNDMIESIRPHFKPVAPLDDDEEEGGGMMRTLMLQHDLSDSTDAVLRALEAAPAALRAKAASSPHGGDVWAAVVEQMEKAHREVLHASLELPWLQPLWRTPNKFLSLDRPALLALEFSASMLDRHLASALDDGDYDLAAVLVREVAFLRQSSLHARAFVGVAF